MGWKHTSMMAAVVIAIGATTYFIVHQRAASVKLTSDRLANSASSAGSTASTPAVVEIGSDFVSKLAAPQLESLKAVPSASVPIYAAALCVAYTIPVDERALAVVSRHLQDHEASHNLLGGKSAPPDHEAIVCLGAIAYASVREGKPVGDTSVLANLAIAYSQRTDLTERLMGTVLAWTLLALTEDPPAQLKLAFDAATANVWVKSELPIHIGAMGEFRRMGSLPPLEYAGLKTSEGL